MATLIGLFTLGRDAELRATQGGDDVAGLALAYNYGRKDQSGKQPTQWIDAALWGDRGPKLQQWLVKGAQFLMHIKDLHVETYDKRDGGQGVKLVGRVAHIEFARGGVPDDSQRAPAPAPAARRPAPAPRAPAAAPRASSGFDDFEDPDIPF